MRKKEVDLIELIVNDTLSLAKNWSASDEVAAIHGVWMENRKKARGGDAGDKGKGKKRKA